MNNRIFAEPNVGNIYQIMQHLGRIAQKIFDPTGWNFGKKTKRSFLLKTNQTNSISISLIISISKLTELRRKLTNVKKN